MSSMTSYGHSYDLSDKLWTWSLSFSDINCEDFEEKAKNEDKNDIFHNFYHAHHDPEGFLSHICQDGSLCDSSFKFLAPLSQLSGHICPVFCPIISGPNHVWF